jgi:hypothetical protein
VSYMRGDYYAYVTGDEDEREYLVLHGDAGSCGCDSHDKHPCIDLPMEIFDQLVVMRFAELLTEKKVGDVIASVAKGGFGNFGTCDLANLCGYDPMDEWVSEMKQRQDEHLASCTDAENCDSPGFHRHGHRGHVIVLPVSHPEAAPS